MKNIIIKSLLYLNISLKKVYTPLHIQNRNTSGGSAFRMRNGVK